MSKGFIETIEEMWQSKNNDIDALKKALLERDQLILDIADKYRIEKNFVCIHERTQNWGNYCDDCPLRELASGTGYTPSVFCRRSKNWSK